MSLGVLLRILGEGANRRLAALRAISRRFSKPPVRRLGAGKAQNLASVESLQSPSTGFERFESTRSTGIGFELSASASGNEGSPLAAPSRASASRSQRQRPQYGLGRQALYRLSKGVLRTDPLYPISPKENGPKRLPACLPVGSSFLPEFQSAERLALPNVAELRSDEELRPSNWKIGLTGVNLNGSFFFMERGHLLEKDVILISRVEERDPQGKAISNSITDIREVPSLSRDEVFARICKRPHKRMRNTVGIVQVGNPDKPSEAPARTLKLLQIDQNGHFVEPKIDGVTCENPEWGAE
jgi:hypothetical protein